jgi:hypothetical protein
MQLLRRDIETKRLLRNTEQLELALDDQQFVHAALRRVYGVHLVAQADTCASNWVHVDGVAHEFRTRCRSDVVLPTRPARVPRAHRRMVTNLRRQLSSGAGSRCNPNRSNI